MKREKKEEKKKGYIEIFNFHSIDRSNNKIVIKIIMM